MRARDTCHLMTQLNGEDADTYYHESDIIKHYFDDDFVAKAQGLLV